MLFIQKLFAPNTVIVVVLAGSDIDRVLLDGSLHLSPTELADPRKGA